MVVLNGTFDGKHFVVDKVPDGLAPNTPIRIVIPTLDRPAAFADIAAHAIEGHMPPDFSAEHEHYAKGTPKKE